MREELSPTSHGSPLHTGNSASSVTPRQAADSLRAPAHRGMRGHEGGPGPARMKKRLLTVLLAAGVLVSAALTAFTIPAAAQTVTCSCRAARSSRSTSRPARNPNDIQLPGPARPADHPAPTPTTPTTPTAPNARADARAGDDAGSGAPGPPSPTPARAPAAARRRSAATRGQRVERDEADGERKLSGTIKARTRG